MRRAPRARRRWASERERAACAHSSSSRPSHGRLGGASVRVCDMLSRSVVLVAGVARAALRWRGRVLRCAGVVACPSSSSGGSVAARLELATLYSLKMRCDCAARGGRRAVRAAARRRHVSACRSTVACAACDVAFACEMCRGVVVRRKTSNMVLYSTKDTVVHTARHWYVRSPRLVRAP